jgi:HAE1 family hydrophobic/amphiphilic exporter-1
VHNGIVMVDYRNPLRRHGLGVIEATLRGAVTWLRPILITTLTTTLALIPMTIGLGEDLESRAPLGRVVVRGLSVSALFTLFFTPALYSLIADLRQPRHTTPSPVSEPEIAGTKR